MNSALTDWQKIEAVNVFVLSGLEYHLNASIPNRLWLARLTIRRIIKKALKLPKRTLTAFFHTARKDGGLRLTSKEDRLDISLVKRALVILSCQDRRIQDVAWSQLTSTLKCRGKIKENLTSSDIGWFLNTPASSKESCTARDVRSLWSLVRKSLFRLKCTVQLREAEVYLSMDKKLIHSIQKGLLTNVLVETTHESRLF